MTNPQTPLARRIITAKDELGRSYIAEDGLSPSVTGVSGFVNNNIWRTHADVKLDAPDTILDQNGLYPPAGGTVFRICDIPPEPSDPDVRNAAYRDAAARNIYPDLDHRPSDRHPGMHRTETIDYAIILSGEMYAIMDEGETLMKAGDVLIQRGTSHAWSNRSDAPCRVAFILVDARSPTQDAPR